MKAIVFDRAGQPEELLRLDDVPEPQAYGEELLVRVNARPIHPADLPDWLACQISLNLLTAWALLDEAEVRPGDWVTRISCGRGSGSTGGCRLARPLSSRRSSIASGP